MDKTISSVQEIVSVKSLAVDQSVDTVKNRILTVKENLHRFEESS